jgi:hypothetical protein
MLKLSSDNIKVVAYAWFLSIWWADSFGCRSCFLLYHSMLYTQVFILLPIYSIVFLLFYPRYILYVVYISHVIGSGLQKHVYFSWVYFLI